MSAEFWYWLFMAVYLFVGIGGVYSNRATLGGPGWVWPIGFAIIPFVLFLIVGLKLFGSFYKG